VLPDELVPETDEPKGLLLLPVSVFDDPPNILPKLVGAELSRLKVFVTRLTKPQKHRMTAKPMMLQSRYMPRSLLFSLSKKN
jgi:hypothetical protein